MIGAPFADIGLRPISLPPAAGFGKTSPVADFEATRTAAPVSGSAELVEASHPPFSAVPEDWRARAIFAVTVSIYQRLGSNRQEENLPFARQNHCQPRSETTTVLRM